MKFYSFDIFDTTLIRKCGKAENVFWLLGNYLFPNDKSLATAFYNSRLKVNRILTELDSNYSLKDVYCHREWKSFPNYTYNQFILAEKQIEAEQLIGNPEAIELITKYRKDGGIIVFISDMYLDSLFLKKILKRENAWSDGDIIYISNEHKVRKDTGYLYDKIRAELNPKSWIHFGDNLYSDIKIARKKKISAKRIHTEYTEIEQKLLNNSVYYPEPKQISLLVGASRMARLQLKNDSAAVLAADYLGPVYIPYVIHIISDALQRGIKVLYFLSRDGYILKKIAEIFPHNDLELKYLFVSRNSLLLPYLYKADKDDFLNIFHKHSICGEKVQTLLKKLFISSEDLIKADVSFSYSVIQNKVQEDDFLELLFSGKLYEIWQKKAEDKYKVAIGYLVQEGLMKNNSMAFVDVGWLGASRLMINRLRKKINPDCFPIFTYYWGIRKNVIAPEYGLYNVFMREISLTGMVTSLMENYFSLCPYATTVSYECNVNGDYNPILKDSIVHNEQLISYNENVISYILNCIKKYSLSHTSLYAWASISVNSLIKMEYKVDYSPLISVDMKKSIFVKKLTGLEVLKILLGGGVTEIDSFSLEYSLGREACKVILGLHHLLDDVKSYLKQKFNNLRQR